MKLLTLLLATSLATVLAAPTTEEKAAADAAAARAQTAQRDLAKRAECYIICPLSRAYCEATPYNYRCDHRGRFAYDRRDTACESTTTGCYCSCDFTGPGVEEVGGAGGVDDAVGAS